MEEQFKLIRQTRKRFIDLVSGLSIEQLNEIPNGMSNNIAWNFGHIVSSQQGLCNGFSGVPVHVPAELTAGYKKGTKPEAFISQDAIDRFKKYAVSAIDQLEKELQENAYSNYTPYETSYGYTLNNIDDAVRFFAVHDALHLGYAMAIRKNLSQQ
ncbi:DinB family protein [Ferruginibacter sp.]